MGEVTKRNRREHRLPGNDGRWFLELVGAEQPPPDTSVTLAKLASPDPDVIPGSEPTATIGRHGGILLGHDSVTNTNGDYRTSTAITAEAIAADPDTEATLGTWEPEELSTKLRSQHKVRWTVLAFIVVIGAAAGAAAFWLPRAAEREAAATAADFSSAMADLRNELPDSQGALAVITNPLTTPVDMAAVIPATAELDAKSHVVSQLATEPMSSRLSFLPGDPMAALQPTQERMSFLGAGGEQVATRIGRGYVYRTTMPQLLVTPLLPASIGDSSEINALSVTLAASLADSVDLVAALPADTVFDAARQAAIDAIERYEDWIVDYLAALRNGDPEQVQGFIRELDGLREGLELHTAEALLVLRSDVDTQILDLATNIEAAIAAMPNY
jgi:hypothetical protein